MSEKTAIEKMVDELEAELASHEDRYGRELTRHHIERALRLASLEAKEAEHKCQYGKTFYGDNTEQLVLSVVEWLKKVSPSSLEAEPPANADLVGELKKCLDHAHPSVYGSDCDEYWWKGYDKKEEDIKEILSKYRPVPVVKEQGEAGLKNKAYGECKNVGKTCRACHAEHCTTRVYFIPTPAPVVSGLVEAAIEAADVLNSIMPSNPKSKKREWIWQVHNRLTTALSRYSKEAK